MPAVTVERTDLAVPSADAVLAQASAENFRVASRVLPRAQRDHLIALYGYARLVDDIGDEQPGDRAAQLDWVEGELDTIYAGATPSHALMARVAETIGACALPREPFDRLVAANRQDQTVTRYADFDALLAYCDLSAAPVGELVLRIFGQATPERIALSDRVCAGLQVVEHLQDVAEDFAMGRVYLPQADLDAFGCSEADIAAPTASGPLRAALAGVGARAAQLLSAGPPLVRELPRRPAFAVAGFTGGGRAALGALRAADWDVLGQRPRPARVTVLRAVARTLLEARRWP
jgi:squalene synthase HpnC